jgi:uncharacterized protein (DUF111 family)
MPREGGKNAQFKAGTRKLLTFWLHADEYEELRRIAEEKTVPLGTVVRWMINEALIETRVAKKKA